MTEEDSTQLFDDNKLFLLFWDQSHASRGQLKVDYHDMNRRRKREREMNGENNLKSLY